MTAIEITGNQLDNFVQTSVLLYKLDPARGDPRVIYSLDQDEVQEPRDRLLKRKFLDSIALLCSTVKDNDSVSAACLEESDSGGTVLRVASNAGVSTETLLGLQNIIRMLNSVAAGNLLSLRTEVLRKIVELDRLKINHYVDNVVRSAGPGGLAEPASSIESRIFESKSHSHTAEEFLNWYQQIFSIRTILADEPAEDALCRIITWAESGRSYYPDLMNVAFPTNNKILPGWAMRILKLGRYSIAARSLVQLAVEQPELFEPMQILAVDAPPKLPHRPSEETSLTPLLTRINGDRFKPRLASCWEVEEQNLDSSFRNSCRLDLVVHAEMQLLSFYDDNPDCTPTFRYIGASKKSCYLCQNFLELHPESFQVASCHQKIYPTWRPPPTVTSYQEYKIITRHLMEYLQMEAKQHLLRRLGERRPVNADSTVGHSLGGLTGSRLGQYNVTGRPDQMLSAQTNQVGRETRQTENLAETQAELSDSQSTRVETVQPVNLGSRSTGEDVLQGPVKTTPPRQLDMRKASTMVFHFVRANSPNRQDIVCISDILNPMTQSPSWSRLTDLLGAEAPLAICFKEGVDYLLVDEKIRVSDERQLHACLQYLCNLNVLNTQASVHNLAELSTTGGKF